MFLVRLPRLVAGLVLAASLGTGAIAAPINATGIQRTNHAKFLGAWWTAGDTQQPEANKIMITGKSDRQYILTVNRPSLGLNNVECGPLTVGTLYKSDVFNLKLNNGAWKFPAYVQLEMRNGKIWLELRDRVQNKVITGAPVGNGILSYELVRKR